MKSSLSIQIKAAKAKIIALEPEYFAKARDLSQQVTDERYRWQTYLNSLALLGFVEWLEEQIPNIKINPDNCSIFKPESTIITNTVYNLQVGEFKLCLIVVDNLIDAESISIPPNIIKSKKLAAHFYVLINVLEEEQGEEEEEEAELIVCGFLRYDELMKYYQSSDIKIGEINSSSNLHIPLSYFDPELNNLLLYTRFLKPNAIVLPVENHSISYSTSQTVKSLVNIGKWLEGVFDQGWQSLKDFLPPSLYWEECKSLSWGPARGTFQNTQNSNEIIGSKKYDLGMRLKSQRVALVIRMKPDEEYENEKDVVVQVCPEESQGYLPQSLKLKVTLNPDTEDSEIEEVVARTTDNFIQLAFNESPGKQFKAEISYEDVAIVEQFVL